MISENIMQVINIIVLIVMFGSLSYVVYKRKFDVSIGIGLIIVVYIIFKYVLNIF